MDNIRTDGSLDDKLQFREISVERLRIKLAESKRVIEELEKAKLVSRECLEREINI